MDLSVEASEKHTKNMGGREPRSNYHRGLCACHLSDFLPRRKTTGRPSTPVPNHQLGSFVSLNDLEDIGDTS